MVAAEPPNKIVMYARSQTGSISRHHFWSKGSRKNLWISAYCSGRQGDQVVIVRREYRCDVELGNIESSAYSMAFIPQEAICRAARAAEIVAPISMKFSWKPVILVELLQPDFVIFGVSVLVVERPPLDGFGLCRLKPFAMTAVASADGGRWLAHLDDLMERIGGIGTQHMQRVLTEASRASPREVLFRTWLLQGLPVQ